MKTTLPFLENVGIRVWLICLFAFCSNHAARSETFTFPVPAFEDNVWVPEHNESVWIEGEFVEVWIESYWEAFWVEVSFEYEAGYPGYWDFRWIEGYWDLVQMEGHWEQQTIPGHWSLRTIPPSTLTVYTNDVDSITGTSWIPATGDLSAYHAEVPPWADRFLVDDDFSIEYADDDADEGTVWNEALCFLFRGAMPRVGPPPPVKVRRLPTGRIGIRTGEDPNISVTREEARYLLDVFITDVAVKLREKRGSETYSYLTYEKVSTVDARIYAGKTWGRGQPVAVLARREAVHAVRRPDLLPAIINTAMVTRLVEPGAEYAMLGREQNLIDYHDLVAQVGNGSYFYALSHSDNMRPTPTRPNGHRAVSQDNEDALKYHRHAEDYFGHLWAFTGYHGGWVIFLEPVSSLVSTFVRPPLAY